MTSRYPELDGLRHVVSTPVLLDAEIVALDADGRPDFAPGGLSEAEPRNT